MSDCKQCPACRDRRGWVIGEENYRAFNVGSLVDGKCDRCTYQQGVGMTFVEEVKVHLVKACGITEENATLLMERYVRIIAGGMIHQRTVAETVDLVLRQSNKDADLVQSIREQFEVGNAEG